MTRHITKGFRGFKLIPKQDGSGKVTVWALKQKAPASAGAGWVNDLGDASRD